MAAAVLIAVLCQPLPIAEAADALQKTAVQKAAGPMAFWQTFFARPDAVPAPEDNPQSKDKIALGSELFRDTRLSGNGQRSCASCHRPDRDFADGLKTARGINGQRLRRNTPSLFNLAWGTHFFWDGRAASLEDQARGPIERPDEMAGSLEKISARLTLDPAIVQKFARAFPGTSTITPALIVKALAAFERALVSPVTKFDRWIAGDLAMFSAREVAGFDLFVGRAGCVTCHAGWRFTDNRFHVVGLPSDDPGRGAIPGGVPGWPAFKTPSLREVTKTGPYMHDGSLSSLEAVMDHYAGGFKPVRNLSNNMVRDLTLTPRERAQLIAFLRTLASQ